MHISNPVHLLAAMLSAGGLLTAAGIAAVAPMGTPAPAEPITVTVETITLPPCLTEDSPHCYWDASTMGNGVGESFVTIDGVTYYPRNGGAR